MILAEKIMTLRKQRGWSQEELAVRLNVSRQSVSKWESGASMPDLDKILKLSEIFGVSTDYLLKEDAEEEEPEICYESPENSMQGTAEGSSWQRGKEDSWYGADRMMGKQFRGREEETAREVTLEEANTYMDLVEQSAKRIAAGVVACILSPVLLIVLGGMAEYGMIGITEDMAGGIGVTVLLVIIAGAVAVFISNGMKLEKYDYMEKDILSLQYGIAGIVERKKESFEPLFKKCIALGVGLCIISAVPIMIAAAFQMEDIVFVFCVAVLLVLVAMGVFLFVWSGMIYGSYQKLLEEGDFTREKKIENRRNDNLSKVYWSTAAAIYLGWSFLSGKWHITWVIWPCAGVLYAAVCGIAAMIRGTR